MRRFYARGAALVITTIMVTVVAGMGSVSAQPTPAPVPLPAPVSTKPPWTWPSIPACLKDADVSTSGQDDFRSPACDVYLALLSSGATDIELGSAAHVSTEVNGVLYPAFLPGTEVVRFIVTERFSKAFGESSELVRVSTTSNAARYGSWWTTVHQVEDNQQRVKSADELRSELALTYSPSCIAHARAIRAGVRGYMGIVAPAFDEPGGGVEFWFPPDAVVADLVTPVTGGAGCPTPAPARP